MTRPIKVEMPGNQMAAPSRPTRKPGPQRPVVSNAFRLGYLIHDVSRMRRTIVDQYLKPEGITRSQWWVLANLSRQGGDGLVGTDLAKLLDVGKVTLGGLIDRLEMAGYVYRRGDKEDRRVKRIFISQSGYALIERMRPIVEALNARIVEGLSPTQIRETELKLTRMKDNLRRLLLEAGDDVENDL